MISEGKASAEDVGLKFPMQGLIISNDIKVPRDKTRDIIEPILRFRSDKA